MITCQSIKCLVIGQPIESTTWAIEPSFGFWGPQDAQLYIDNFKSFYE